MSRWLTPEDVVSGLRRRFDAGEFLTLHAQGRVFEPLSVGLRPPTSRELAERFGDVEDWARRWVRFADVKGLRLDTVALGGRLVGSNPVPARVWVDEAPVLWRLLGVAEQVHRYTELLEVTCGPSEPSATVLPSATSAALRPWMAAHPGVVIANERVWERLVATAQWILEHGTPTVYLRQIDVPGVDTKFVEQHRGLLSAVLDELLPRGRIDSDVPRSALAARYGLAAKPAFVRLRRLDGTSLLASGGPAELGMRVADLALSPVAAAKVIVIENDVSYLAFPAVPDAVAVFGEGYAAARLAGLGWLADREVHYWGDLDTHGFSILNQFRAFAPQARSLLMDRATLLEHEAHWGQEAVVRNVPPTRLTLDEASLYADLVEGRYGVRIRLEQERIRFGRVREAARGLLRG